MINKLRDVLRSRGDFAKTLDQMDLKSGLGDSAWVLYGLTRAMKPTTAVEIGSARGKSACFVGRALKDNGHGRLYAIDPHAQTAWNDVDSVDTYEVLRANLRRAKVDGHVEIMRATSDIVAGSWNRPIDLIFIDGDHSYEGVRRDWELFSPFLTSFSTAVFHDTIWDLRPDPRYSRADMGVPRFVEELRQQGYPVLTFERDYGVSLVQPRLSGIPLSSAAATSSSIA
jgi:predicted O-methyltransferase YrrM